MRMTDLASIKAITYWLRLSALKEDRLLRAAFKVQQDLDSKGVICWASKVKASLG